MAAALTPTEVLDAWEAGREADPLTRAATLWRAATGRPPAEPVDLPVGRRDRALLHARIATFGPVAPSYVECPRCGEELEFELDLTSLDAGEAPAETAERFELDHADWHVEFRLPLAEDVRAVAAGGRGPADLLERCVLTARREGAVVEPAAAAVALLDELDAEMERLDPQAGITLRLECVACSHPWRVRFDIAHFLWREVEVEAGRVLREVHRLARAYGWSEPEILALSPARRRAYLDLLSGGQA